jgi:hypothetical protein
MCTQPTLSASRRLSIKHLSRSVQKIALIPDEGLFEVSPSHRANPLSPERRQIKEQLGALTETMSSGAPLTIWYNLSTKPEGAPFLPSPPEGTGLVDFGLVDVILCVCGYRRSVHLCWFTFRACVVLWKRQQGLRKSIPSRASLSFPENADLFVSTSE